MVSRIEDYAVVDIEFPKERLDESELTVIKELVKAADIVSDIFSYQKSSIGSEVYDFVKYVDEEALPTSMREVFELYRQKVLLHYGVHDSSSYEKFYPEMDEMDFIDALSCCEDIEIIADYMFSKNAEPIRYPGANVIRGLTKEDIEDANDVLTADLQNWYTTITANPDGSWESRNYTEEYRSSIEQICFHLSRAEAAAESDDLKDYLEKTRLSLELNYYQERDIAFLRTDTNVNFMIGPVETYIEKLMNSKAAFQASISVRNYEAEKKMDALKGIFSKFVENLPCDDAYKNRKEPKYARVEFHDTIYSTGDGDQGVKTLACALPNDEEVTSEYGHKSTMYLNIMKAKAEMCLIPIAEVVLGKDVVETYGAHNLADALVIQIIGHEVSHPLGETREGIDPNMRANLGDTYNAIEECKADVLSVYNLDVMVDEGLIAADDLDVQYAYTVASAFRSIRLGTESSHAKANMIFLNYLIEKEGIMVNDRTYSVDRENYRAAIKELATELLTIEGEGDKQRAETMLDKYMKVGHGLQATIDKIDEAGIPRDIQTVYRVKDALNIR